MRVLVDNRDTLVHFGELNTAINAFVTLIKLGIIPSLALSIKRVIVKFQTRGFTFTVQ